MRVLLLALFVLALNTSVSAAHALVQDHSQHQQSSDSDPFNDAQVQYVCPMHSQIVKDQAGTCPICGMDLVEREKKQEPQV